MHHATYPADVSLVSYLRHAKLSILQLQCLGYHAWVPKRHESMRKDRLTLFSGHHLSSRFHGRIGVATQCRDDNIDAALQS